jgi:hypothetical protein
MEWYEVMTLCAFFGVVLFPARTFEQVDKYMLEDFNEPDTVLNVSHSKIMQMGTSAAKMENETKILTNLDRMIATASSPVMKTLWNQKKETYLRTIRWKTLVEYSGGIDSKTSR